MGDTVKFWGANETPSPAMVYIFMSKTGIPHEDVVYEQLSTFGNMASRGNRSNAEYLKMTPMRYIPTVKVGNDDPVVECTSVLRYLSAKFHGIDSPYYPANDPVAMSKINSYLDFHQTSLRPGWLGYVQNMQTDPAAAATSFWGANEGFFAERPNGLSIMTEFLGRFWIKDGPFLVGRQTPSVADFACLADMSFAEAMGVTTSPQYDAWKKRMVDFLGDDPAWVSYRDNAVAAISGMMPPAPEKPAGYPWGWTDPLD